jgi:hypothetical protein
MQAKQYSARNRIKGENTIPITGTPGTGKSTVISLCCFDLLREYSTVVVSLDKMGTLFSSLRDNNAKIIGIGNDKQLPPPSNDYMATSLFRAILRYFKKTLLRREYRFNQDILDLINPYYDYKLVADQSVSHISTADIAKKNYDGTNRLLCS